MSTPRASALPKVTLERVVLERQLALFSKPMAVSVYGLPLWSLVVCWILSGAYPRMGSAPLVNIAGWFAIICVTCAIAFVTDIAYRRAKANPETFDAYQWMPRMTAALSLLSAAWASVIWLFWDPANEINQMVLVTFVVFGIMNGMVARMNRFEAYLAGSGTSFLILWLRCVTTNSGAAEIFSIVIPILFLVLSSAVLTASRQIYDHLVAQIENEHLKDENARARDDAERANRMKSAFLANMSHELRTPLNAILGFSEIISSQAFGPAAADRYRDYANDIHESGRYLLDMINSLLDVAKIEAGKLELDIETVDAGGVIEHASRLVASRAQAKGVSVHTFISPLAQTIQVDERAFRQIAINLLSNAVKFTERGSIETRLEPVDGAIVLSVTDTGCGIPATQVGGVFEAFEQVDNRYTKSNGGTGLGLTLVRALARLHGGDCRIDSTPGCGTTVYVTFPQPDLAGLPAGEPSQHRVA
jgi:two-component system cell cycle sensor histidine kinase PleC